MRANRNLIVQVKRAAQLVEGQGGLAGLTVLKGGLLGGVKVFEILEMKFDSLAYVDWKVFQERLPRSLHQLPVNPVQLVHVHLDQLSSAGLGFLLAGAIPQDRLKLAAWRRRRRLLLPSQAYVPLIFDPGEAYQFDWSHEHARLLGTTTKVKAAHMRLCHSRMYLVQIFPRESQEMVFEAHERAFSFFGGVCRRGIYDNMKTAVNAVFVGKKREYNRRFLEMCSHHLIEPSRVHARGAHDGVHSGRRLGEGAG